MQAETAIRTYGYEYDVERAESLRQVSADVETFTVDRGDRHTKHDTILRAVLLHSTFILHVGSREFTNIPI